MLVFFYLLTKTLLRMALKAINTVRAAVPHAKQSTDLPRQLCVQLEKCIEVERWTTPALAIIVVFTFLFFIFACMLLAQISNHLL